jgi:hypothetical protein
MDPPILDQPGWINAIKNNKVTELNLVCTYAYHEIDIYKELLEALKTNTSVDRIRIEFNYSILFEIYDEWTSMLSDVLKINTTLMRVALVIRDLTKKGLKFLYDGLSMNTSIKTVDITYFNLPVDNYKLLNNMLKNNSYLTSIQLYCIALDVDAWSDIMDSLKVNKTLLSCRLHCNDTFYNGTNKLKELLLVNKTLERLELQVYCVDYAEFISILKQNSSILYFVDYSASPTITDSIKNKINKYCGMNRYNKKLKNMMLQDIT